MKKWHSIIVLPVVFFLASCQPAQQTDPALEITVIEGATVIDGVSDTPIEDAVIVIAGDTIQSIGSRGSVEPPPGARTIDATGKTILPGIFNLHGHVAMSEGFDRRMDNYTRERVQRDANSYLYYGVTHSVSLGLDQEPMPGFQADQRAGLAGGARLYSAGLGFAAMDGWEPAGVEEINRPTTPEEARAMVQQELAKGSDVLKIWVDDRLGELPKITPELYGAIIDEAHRNNLKVLAHMFYLEDAKELMRRGVDALAHSVRDQEVDEEFLALAKETGVTQVTTLIGHYGNLTFPQDTSYLDHPGVPLMIPADALETLRSEEYQNEMAAGPGMERSRGFYETALKNAAAVAAAGIPIAVGTDSSGASRVQGLWEHREMEHLVKAGLTPMQAIQAATVNGARMLGVEDKYGTLQPGKVADLIVLDANPLSDITNSRKIDAVWMNGKPVDRAALAGYQTAPN